MIIFLCGFMGSGKTTLMKTLQASTMIGSEINFVDLDQTIIESAGKFDSVDNFVSVLGWDHFRSRERELIFEYCKKGEEQNYIVSLGGGALSEGGLAIIKQNSNAKLLWVDTEFDVCYQRIKNDSNRPLVKKGGDFLRELYNSRCEHYKQADFVFGENEQNEIIFLEQVFKN